MKLKQEKLYAYRFFAGSHQLIALLPFSSLKEVWNEIEQNSVLHFIFPSKTGDTIEATIRTSMIVAIDRPWGTEPVSQKAGPEKADGVSNRATIKQGKIVLGQVAKREKK
jgi:hypothetical protein